MAFRKLQIQYAMPQSGTVYADGVLYQHDFQGRRIFQHRYRDKWSLWIPNKRINGFALEEDCRACLRVLRKSWNGRITNGNGQHAAPPSSLEAAISKELTTHRYELCIAGKPPRTLSFALDGKIDGLRRDEPWSWNLRVEGERISLKILADTTLAGELERKNKRHWISCIGEPASLRRISNRPAKDQILLRASVNTYTGYGLHAVAIISGLTRQGYDLQIAPIGFDEKFSAIPESIKNRITYADNNGNWELLLYPPNKKPTPGKKTVYLTMWEATRIPQQYIPYLNMAECLIVPCRWNVENFTAQGVTRPIYQVPLGIYTNIYKYSPMLLDGPCIFGAAGRLASGGIRKGLDKVIDAFQEAFPVEQDVRLYVKAFSDCPLPEANDPRIVILQKYLTDQEMAAWYRSITCFVSASSGEAWGLMQHQAMATGRPIISVDYGGVKEFFSKDTGYPLDYKLVPADKFYANCGVWAEPSLESLIEQMRNVYQDRKKAELLGRLSSKQVSGLSWRASNQQLAQVLRHIGMCH